MPSTEKARKKEDWLGLNDHEDQDSDASRGSDDDREESRTAGISSSRGAKRRKVERSDDDDDNGHSSSGNESGSGSGSGSDNDDVDEDEAATSDTSFKAPAKKPTKQADKKSIPASKSNSISPSRSVSPSATPDPNLITDPTKLTPLTPTELAASRARVRKTGVTYLSRIPPFMRPQKVKALLSRFGEVGRVFLAPEDPKTHARRVKFGGSKKRNYEEGWVEFMDKRVAKLVAETLNATIVGGKKNNYYHDDVWNIKYLPKFKWHHLQAQIAYENASRQAKLRAEISQATRENKTFIRNVERAKMVENIKESKKRKAEKEQHESTSGGTTGKEKEEDDGKLKKEEIEVRRQFRQNKIKGQKANKEEGVQSSEAVKRVLGKIF
ncbi:hypothetical protein BDZ91DRAFT_844361 [Kalaharituber pfeilii]|nr:hypothetical protein BDZ91DRAFT_844361 [Kalaharituber pfeilii]